MRELKRKHGKTEQKKGSLLAALCIITALAVVLSTGAVSLARYAMQRRIEDVAAAEPFYFVSDCLSADKVPPSTQLEMPASGDTAQISFTVSNHIDNLRRSKKPIVYTCTASVDGEEIPCTVTADGKAVSEDTHEITLPVSEKGTNQTVTLEVEKKYLNGTVTVVAEAKSPYEKAISGTFDFADGITGVQYAVHEENGAVVLELMGPLTGYTYWAIDVTWPEGLIPDPSCTYLFGNVKRDDSTRTVTVYCGLPPAERIALTFLKTEPGEYGKEKFKVVPY